MMSNLPSPASDLQTATFRLAAELHDLPEAAAAREVVDTFSRAPEEPSFSTRGLYNQYAGSVGMQFQGYLVVEAMTMASEAPPFVRPPRLEPAERSTLASAHRAFAELNARCLAPLAATRPSAARSATPYSRYTVDPGEGPPFPFFGGSAAQAVVEVFAHHPALSLALETGASVPFRADVATLVQLIGALEKELWSLGPGRMADYLVAVPGPVPAPVWAAALPHISALACLRASLNVMNEVLYQSLLWGSPICVTEGELTAMGPREATAFGVSSTIDYLSGGAARMPFQGERVLVLHPLGSSPSEGTLHEITGSQIQLMEASVRVRVNDADRWLNPAPDLLAVAREVWEHHR
jgi:hypothetical protein